MEHGCKHSSLLLQSVNFTGTVNFIRLARGEKEIECTNMKKAQMRMRKFLQVRKVFFLQESMKSRITLSAFFETTITVMKITAPQTSSLSFKKIYFYRVLKRF
jgi:hypothetical protein